MDRRQYIKDFVQHTLGCSCPDKVFDQIVEKPVTPSASPHSKSFVIGNKLLINIWYVRETAGLRKNLMAMLAAGRMERDAHGLGRFRAVVAADRDMELIEKEAKACLDGFPGRDSRIHIHVVPAEDVRLL
jgi:hypothetical protein